MMYFLIRLFFDLLLISDLKDMKLEKIASETFKDVTVTNDM